MGVNVVSLMTANPCPDPQQVLRRVLTPELFERHEELTLQRMLDRMADLVYCPRCSQPVLEDSTHCAQCTRCRLDLRFSVAFEPCQLRV